MVVGWIRPEGALQVRLGKAGEVNVVAHNQVLQVKAHVARTEIERAALAAEQLAPERPSGVAPPADPSPETTIYPTLAIEVGSSAADPSPVPDHVVDDLARTVAKLVRGAELGCSYEVGRLVAQRFYAGRPGGWRDRRPKDTSLVRLVKRLRAYGFSSPSALHRCLRTYEVLAPLGGISALEYLSPSHVQAVFPAPPDQRADLLRQAQENHWTSRQLDAVVAAIPGRSTLGRPRARPLARVLQKLEIVVRELEAVAGDTDLWAGADDATHLSTYNAFIAVMQRLELHLHSVSPKRHRAARRILPIGTQATRNARSEATSTG